MTDEAKRDVVWLDVIVVWFARRIERIKITAGRTVAIGRTVVVVDTVTAITEIIIRHY